MPNGGGNGGGLPTWAHTIVFLGLFALLAYNVVKLGAEGYGISLLIGGLLGGYIGINELVKRFRDGDAK